MDIRYMQDSGQLTNSPVVEFKVSTPLIPKSITGHKFEPVLPPIIAACLSDNGKCPTYM
jgi:hypothetical protein